MDLILLPGEPSQPPQPAQRAVTSAEGGRYLEHFFEWQREGGGSPDLYAVVPPDADLQEALLALLGGRLGALADRVYALVPPSLLSRSLLDRLEAVGPLHLILTATTGEAAIESGLDTLAAHLADHPDSSLYLGVWLDLRTGSNSGASYHCAHRLVAAGMPADLIDVPGFTLDSGSDHSGTEVVAAPEAFLTGLYFCQLYRHAITVDRWGQVRACPRAVGNGTMLPLGNLFDDDPETLLRRKGEASHRICTMELCAGCQQHGQFSWPDRLSERASELFHDGLRRGRAMLRPVIDHRRVRQFDLSAENPDGRRRAIQDFASRLQGWSADLEDWESQRRSTR